MTPEQVLADIRSQLPNAGVELSAKDLAVLIKKSVTQQQNLRKEGKLNLPMERRGRRIFVSIYKLADHWATEKPQPPELEVKRGRGRPPKGARIMKMDAQLRMEFIQQIHTYLNLMGAVEVIKHSRVK